MDKTITLSEGEQARFLQELFILRSRELDAMLVAKKEEERAIKNMKVIDELWNKITGEDDDGE